MIKKALVGAPGWGATVGRQAGVPTSTRDLPSDCTRVLFSGAVVALVITKIFVEMFATDFLGNQIDAAMARMFSPIHNFLEMTEKRVAAQKEEDDYKRELQEKGVGERLRSDPMSIILEAKVFSAAFPAACSHERCVIRIIFNAGSRWGVVQKQRHCQSGSAVQKVRAALRMGHRALVFRQQSNSGGETAAVIVQIEPIAVLLQGKNVS
jgi:hypothetical protein